MTYCTAKKKKKINCVSIYQQKAIWNVIFKKILYHNKSNRVPAAKSLQSCPTLWDPIDGSSPGSPVPGILQARTLEWVAISFSNTWKWKVKSESEVAQSCLTLRTSWTVACQATLSIGFSRREYWSGLPLPSPIECLGVHKIKDGNYLYVENDASSLKDAVVVIQ